MKKMGIMTIVASLFIVILGVLMMSFNDDKKVPDKKEPQSENNENNEINENVKKDIMNKIDAMSSTKYFCDIAAIDDINDSCIYLSNSVSKEAISEQYKIVSSIYFLHNDNKTEQILTKDDVIDEEAEYVFGDIVTNYKVSKDLVEKQYKTLFTDNNFDIEKFESVKLRPQIFYKDNFFYIADWDKEEMVVNDTFFKEIEFESDENYYIVTVGVGFSMPDKDGVYHIVNTDGKLEISEMSAQDYKNYELDIESENCSIYKYTFKKSNLSFEKVERVK